MSFLERLGKVYKQRPVQPDVLRSAIFGHNRRDGQKHQCPYDNACQYAVFHISPSLSSCERG